MTRRDCVCGGCRRLDALDAIEHAEPDLYDLDPANDHYPEPDPLDAAPLAWCRLCDRHIERCSCERYIDSADMVQSLTQSRAVLPNIGLGWLGVVDALASERLTE